MNRSSCFLKLCIMHSQMQDLKDTYKFEYKRFETFSTWKVNSPVDASRLAKAGFYYSGIDDEVICFSCKGHIKNWHYGDIVQKRHSELFPNCDFINNCSNNVSISQAIEIRECYKNETISSLQNLNVVKQESCAVNFDKMKSVHERLKSFKLGWPLPSINIQVMAASGFFYLGYEDKVQCSFCKGIMSGWKEEDDPFEKHFKKFPNCNQVSETSTNWKFKKDTLMDTNSREAITEKNFSPGSLSKVGSSLNNLDLLNLKNLGVFLHSMPTSLHQASFSSRLQSFASWPATSPISKENLAKAGFFYIGIKDHTKCFQCDGGLGNWEIGDDPWVEHARWFPNCGFLHLTKGSSFVEECNQNKSHQTEIEVTSQHLQRSSESFMFKVETAMKSLIVQNVIETTKFPLCIIRAAIVKKIKNTGCTFSTVDDLCHEVISLKNEMEDNPLQINCYQEANANIIELREYENIDSDCLQEGHPKEPHCDGKSKQSIHTYDREASLLDEQNLCIICMSKKVNVVFLPCGHLLACTECASALKLCAICRKTIHATVRAYLT